MTPADRLAEAVRLLLADMRDGWRQPDAPLEREIPCRYRVCDLRQAVDALHAYESERGREVVVCEGRYDHVAGRVFGEGGSRIFSRARFVEGQLPELDGKRVAVIVREVEP